MKKYFHQLSLLLWKNFVIKKRSILVFLFELTVPLVLFLIMVAIRIKQHARPVDIAHYNAWPLPSAGFIPIMQSFCNPKYGVKNQYGFLEYPNSTVKQMIEQIDKLSNQNWTFESLLTQDFTQLIHPTRDQHDSINTVEPIFNKYRNESLTNLFNLTSMPHEIQLLRIDYYLLFKFVNQTQILDQLNSSQYFEYDSHKICSSNLEFILDTTPNINTFICNLTRLNNVNRLVNLDYYNKIVVKLFNEAFQKKNKKQDEQTFSLDSIEKVIDDLARLSEHFPHNLCDADKIMKEGDERKNQRRPESIMSDTRDLKYNSSLKENHGFLGIWTNMQKTFCGQEQTPRSTTASNSSQSELNLSKDQIKSLSLLINVVYSNPVILYSPNSSVIRTGLIQRANKTFELLNQINLFSRKWLDQSSQLAAYFNMSNQTQLVNKLEIINSAACSWLTIMSGVNLDLFKGFASESDLVDYFLNSAYYNNQTVIASLVFNLSNDSTKLEPHISYKIRQNASFTYTTKKIRERYWYPSPRDWDYYYYLFGFTWLQDLIDRAIIDYHSNATILEPGSYFQQMPYPCYTYDNFLQMIQHVMPLCLSISFVYSVSMLTQTIVIEKELRLKEVMKIMGLNNSCHLVAWFITYFLQFTFIMMIVTLILHFGKILSHSNPFLIFFLLELYAIATICFSFLVSSLYSKAKLAAACAGILYFLSYVPCMYISIREDVAMEIVPWWKKTFAAFLSTSAFGMASKYIAFYENDGTGIQWQNMDKSPLESDQYTCYQCIRIMILDCFLYWILAWYIENVRPSYGIPLKWYFPFKLSYWLGNEKGNTTSCFDCFKSNKLSHTESDQATLINETHSSKRNAIKSKYLFEQEPFNFKIGVSIHNLTKKYSDSKLAVDNLSINFYENQITSFLGHNGAGKSTTMSMLTGLIPATSGYALIYDKDIRTHINEIRNNLGWCPQHNVLFNLLTVEEHLWFYGQLKQMNPKSIQTLIDNMLRDTGLTKKRNNLIHTLSGGMQRKLSVAIAFVGDANLVILDEPTAGVDPYARRAIWDLLLKYKQGRTIILSTHHMDEAELLGDRIGIISNGKLQCCGTALFLKNALGEGNNLTIVKDVAKIQSELQYNDSQIVNLEQMSNEFMKKNTEILIDFIHKHIPSAYLKDETLREYHFIIPLNERSNPNYWKLFNALELEKTRLNIDSYGIHDVSLEEIFIKAAQIKRVEETEKSDASSNSDDEETSEKSSQNSKNSLYDLDYIYTDLEIGYKFYLKQVLAMFIKRYLYNKRNWISLLTQIILPALFICVAMTVALAAPGFFDLPKIELTPAQYYPLTKPEGIYVPFSHSTQTCSSTLKQQIRSASSLEIASTLQFLTGIGSTCCLNTATTLQKLLLNNKLNQSYFGFTDSCPLVFNSNPDLNMKYFSINKTKTFYSMNTRDFIPKCSCLKDYSGFECSNEYSQPADFKLTTRETLLNISGSNESEYYLYTTDMFRLKRYGGLSFDNENCSQVDVPLVSESLKRLDLIQNLATNRKARVWYNNKGFHAMPTFLNVMNNAILRANVKKTLQMDHNLNEIDSDLEASRFGITVFNHPMNQTNNYLSTEYLLEGSDVLISIFTIVAMSFVNASFVLFLVYERSIKSLHLQFLIGLNPFLYWLTNFIWDMLNYLLPASCVIIILKIFNVPAYVEGANYPAVILLFLLYGFSVSPLMYPMSFWFKEPSNAYIFLIVINLFTGITCVESSFLFQVFSFDKDLKLVYDLMKSLFLIFPPYCLGRGLIDIAYNDYYNTFYTKTGQFNKIRSPFEWDITSRNLVAMSCVGVVSWIFTLLLEYDFFKFKWIKCKKQSKTSTTSDLNNRFGKEDIDVHNERKRIENLFSIGSLSNDELVLKSLKKIYYKNSSQFNLVKLIRKIINYFRRYKLIEKKDTNEFVAVNSLTFGVPQGECFGLLGVNGAGKTTTFKMLTTDLEPSDGNIFIRKNDYVYTDALVNKKTYWNQIGYCPQFDALYDELTPADHIRLFARIKGIKTKYETILCESLLERLDLLNYSNKPVGSLSLGNKRKLSTALSFVGNPKIVLLDEPTSGMDPVSRRHLWQEIINLTRVKNCAVLLTSHSMEEVQVLSTRLAIMVEGKFKCLGSVQHLKTKFGDGYTLTVKIKDMPRHLSEQDDETNETNSSSSNHVRNKYIRSILEALKENISSDCKLKKRHFNNIYQFELPYSHSRKNFDIGSVYRLIELNKLRFNLVDYSLSQNTLDNVFVNFVKEQTQTAKSKNSTTSSNGEQDDDQIDQNYEDDEKETHEVNNTKMNSASSSIQFPIHDNDDLLINLNNSSNLNETNRRVNFDVSNGN